MRRSSGPAARVLLAFVVAGLVAFAATGVGAQEVTKKKVVGGGSTFAQLLIDQWRADTRSKPYSLDLNYQGTGSSQGRQSYIQKTVDFAVSDIPFQPGDGAVPAAGTFTYITAVAGALGMMYNLTDPSGNRVTNLVLDQSSLCRMFTEQGVTGQPMYWDDPALLALNPGVQLPHKAVRPVIRSDGSGTSYVLSEYCIAVAKPVWDAFRAALKSTQYDSNPLQAGQPLSVWPPFNGSIAAPQSTGIANQVAGQSGDGAITYIEAGYTEITNLPLARVKNAHGDAVEPTPAGITVALSYAKIQADGTFQLDFVTPDPKAYFPSTYSYMIVPTTSLDPGKGRSISEYVYYAMTKGQDQAEPLKYARLSKNLIDKATDTASKLSGADTFDAWKASVGLAPAGGTSTTAASGTTTTQPAAGTTTTGAQVGVTTRSSGGSTPVASTSATTKVGTPTTAVTTTPGTPTTTGSAKAPGAATKATGSATVPKVAGVTVSPAVTPRSSAGAESAATTVSGATGATDATSVPDTASPISPAETVAGASAPATTTPVRVPAKAPGPSNSDAVWTFLQGGAVMAAALMIGRSFGMGGL